MDLEKVKEDLKKRLTEKRYNHSLGAMKEAGELAKIYGENEEDAKFAGLIHDIAKEMTKEEIENYIDTHNMELDEMEKMNLGVVHAKIRSKHCKRRIWSKWENRKCYKISYSSVM